MTRNIIAAAAAVALFAGLAAVPTAGAQATRVTVDPSWLRANVATTTAEFTLVAGLTGTNGGMNFDGATKGGLTFVVPVGWHVVLHFRNDDQNLAHSAEVIPVADPVPMGPVTPVFKGAATRNLDTGVGVGSHEDMQFVAQKAGGYLILCGVTGHGAVGMWIRFEVSATATHPSIIAESGAP
jgi:sulfocyanin